MKGGLKKSFLGWGALIMAAPADLVQREEEQRQIGGNIGHPESVVSST